MIPQRLFSGWLVIVGLSWITTPVVAEVYPVILRGKVMMKDGSPPPKSVSIQRLCSDESGSAPGPLTDKKGEYLWRMDVDPMRTRACHLEATLAGYVSSRVDISNLNGYTDTTQTLAPIVLSNKNADPYTIVDSENLAPSKSVKEWKAAMKAVDAGNVTEALNQLQTAVKTSPKFAQAWHTMGILYQSVAKPAEAKDAWQHAIEADPKLLPAYVGLARMCIATKDWPGALAAGDALVKVDTKKVYPEIYLHLAVAHYGQKELDAALSSVQDSIRLDAQKVRGEYVLGRILEAKGDTAGAREHMTKYVSLDPNVTDIELVKKHIEYLGKPEASTVDPNLEP
jgi:tetratricopeptide (TPR) repeat protein